MKIQIQQLSNQLRQRLHPVYLIAGNETLLIDECCDSIRAACLEQGFHEREKHQADKQFDWQSIVQSANSISLFSEKKIIEINLLQSKPGDKGSKALCQYLESPHQDTCLILIMSKLDAPSQRSKWFKAIDKQGCYIPVWPIEGKAFHQWIASRISQKGLQAHHDVIQFIADNVEGNLLAAKQEIDKLALLDLPSPLSLEKVSEAMVDSSRYTVFHLVDQCLNGDFVAAMKIFNRLNSEGIEWHLLLWSLTKELRTLYELSRANEQGLPLNNVFKQQRVFDARQYPLKIAMQRLTSQKVMQLIILSRNIDQSIKGLNQNNPALLFQQLIMRLCG